MFDHQAVWEMNQSHHKELLGVAAKCRLLRMADACSPITLESLRRAIPSPTVLSRLTNLRAPWWSERRLAH